ncbi:uncharacterized protein PHACADRAFT_262147 [Phanerochaete carnosa HHB-10118-sp]|uniref:Uncharacterized protein n=1 Tax=Phanerochaete carnosa (strain HHB-10118-sp) TaxID=650164 RepID=K5VYE7_PHACS|nr:uncharacterized protein PHACADRAFT_262147 [Phanerochaete carnosa HHB-10118-sp]EKM51805.1 hypothetical protein PHACADRAFT_262147 [Phanerochaete carnosa HHB-10118-sp]
MYTQITDVLFSEREDSLWDASTLFPGESRNLSVTQPMGVFDSNDYPLLLSYPNPMLHKSLDDLSLSLNAPPSLPEVAPMSWRTAATEAAEGIHYVKERFPSEHVSYLSPPFRMEPIQVEANEKVVLLDEVSDFAVRVRKVDDGTVGVVPVWDIEDPLERLARMNMELNEIVTSPSSPAFRRTFATSFPNQTFVHSINDKTGAAADGSFSSPEMGSDDDLPVTPTSLGPTPRKLEARKVEFAQTPQKTIFRYLRPEHFDPDVSDDERWCDGWEEREGAVDEESEGVPAEGAAPAEQERPSRPRLRRQEAFFA